MDETNPSCNSNPSSPSDYPLYDNTNDPSPTNSNLIIKQQQVSATTPLQQDHHHQQPINPSTPDIGETKTQTSEDLPSSSSSSSSSSSNEQEHKQQRVNTSTSNDGETMPHNSNLRSRSSVTSVQVPRPTLQFQQQQRLKLMNMVQSAYSPKNNAFVMPELPSVLEGCPPIPQFNIPKDSMERMLANMRLPPPRSFNRTKIVPSILPRSIMPCPHPPPSSSLKIRSESRNIKKPPLPPYTYLRPRTRPPRASSDDKLFKIPPLPASWRAPNKTEADPSGGDGSNESSDTTMPKEDLGLPSTEQQNDSTEECSMSIDDNNDGCDNGSTSDIEEHES